MCVPENGAVLLGLARIKDVGDAAARAIVEEREQRGAYGNAADLVSRTGIKPQAVSSLVMAGAFDSVASNRQAGAVGFRSCHPPTPQRTTNARRLN